MPSAVEKGVCFGGGDGGRAGGQWYMSLFSFLLSIGPGASKLYWVFQEPSTFVEMIIPNHQTPYGCQQQQCSLVECLPISPTSQHGNICIVLWGKYLWRAQYLVVVVHLQSIDWESLF